MPGISKVNCAVNMASGNSQNSVDDMPNADCDDASVQSESSTEEVTFFPDSSSTVDQTVADQSTLTNQWERFGARPRDVPPIRRVPQDPTRPVIASVNNSSLAGTSYVEDMMNCIESNRAEPCTISCQAAARPDDERNYLRFMLQSPASMGENAVGAVGGPNEPLNTGFVQPRLVSSSTRSNGAHTGLQSEMGSSGESHFPTGNASGNPLSSPGDQAASEAAAEPCRAVDPCFNSDSMSDRDSSTDATMNAALLTLAQRIQHACAHVQQEREERLREGDEWERGNRGLQGRVVGSNFETPFPVVDYPGESLDSVHNTASTFQQGVIRARAFARREAASRVEVTARWCRCAQPTGEVSRCYFLFLGMTPWQVLYSCLKAIAMFKIMWKVMRFIVNFLALRSFFYSNYGKCSRSVFAIFFLEYSRFLLPIPLKPSPQFASKFATTRLLRDGIKSDC